MMRKAIFAVVSRYDFIFTGSFFDMATTVDKIRRALEKRDGIAEEEMRPLADAYRTQVQQVNQRLDDSVMLLRKGLRSEAIQRIEMTPNALDAAAELEFPEWEEWIEILQFMAIPLPAQLNHDYVAQINEAIIESLPLDALLRRHRRLAIAKAPLGVRLRTLRQIARVDANNGVWSDDIETWEKLRLQQIDAELKSALESEDAKNLYQLHKELTGGPWRIKPSPRLVEQSSFAAEAHVRQNMEVELGRIAPSINAAFEKRDERAARKLRSEWQAARSKYNVNVPAELEVSVGPAMQWLEDLDRQAVMESERQIAMANLQSTLDSEQPLEEVQKAYDQASKFGVEVPEELSDRMQKLAEKPAKQRMKKLQMIGIAAGVVLIAAIAGGATMMMSSNKKKADDATIQQMESLVSAGQFDEAVSFYTTVLGSNPSMASNPKMIALNATARKAVDDESARVERFEKLYEQASNDDPSLIDETLLPQLEELAISEVDKARVSKLVKQKEDYFAAEAVRQTDEMLGKVGQYQAQFGQLQSRGSSEENRLAIQSLLSSISRLPTQYPRGSDDAAGKVQTLRDQVSMVLRRMKDDGMITEQRNDAIEALMSSRTLEVFSDQLAEYSTQSVARTNFVEFETVLDEETHWLNVDKANVWLDTLGEKAKAGFTAPEAFDLMTTAKDLKKLISPNPIFSAIPKFDDEMQEITNRRQILDETYVRIAKHPLARLVTLSVNDGGSPTGKTSHLLEQAWAMGNRAKFSNSGSIGVPVISDALGGTKPKAFAGPLPKTSEEPMKSMVEIVDQKTRFRTKFDENWEKTFIERIADVTRRPNLDGVVKEWVIAQLFEAAIRGSDRLKDALPQTKRALDRRLPVREAWFRSRPTEPAIEESFRTVMIAELKVAFDRFNDPLSDYKSTSEKRLEWIGFLAKSMTGQIEYHLRGALPEYDGKLYVAVPSRDGDAKTSIISVGELSQGHIQLTPNPVYQVPGRPLFLFPN